MGRYDLHNEDPLREYLDHEGIEKAPEGFTGNTMTRIGMEAGAVSFRRGILMQNRIPLVAGLVILLLVITAVVVPVDQTDTVFSTVIKAVNNLRMSMPDLNIFKGINVSIPGWTLYGLFSIILIGVVDRGLFRLFHKTE